MKQFGWAFASALVLIAVMIGPHFYWQVVVGYPLRRTLGFGDGSPYTRESPNGPLREVAAIYGVRPGSEAARAGLRNYDVLLDYSHPDRGLSEFYEDLHLARGRELCVRVVPFFAEVPLAQRPVKTACLRVPPT